MSKELADSNSPAHPRRSVAQRQFQAPLFVSQGKSRRSNSNAIFPSKTFCPKRRVSSSSPKHARILSRSLIFLQPPFTHLIAHSHQPCLSRKSSSPQSFSANIIVLTLKIEHFSHCKSVLYTYKNDLPFFVPASKTIFQPDTPPQYSIDAGSSYQVHTVPLSTQYDVSHKPHLIRVDPLGHSAYTITIQISKHFKFKIWIWPYQRPLLFMWCATLTLYTQGRPTTPTTCFAFNVICARFEHMTSYLPLCITFAASLWRKRFLFSPPVSAANRFAKRIDKLIFPLFSVDNPFSASIVKTYYALEKTNLFILVTSQAYAFAVQWSSLHSALWFIQQIQCLLS